MASFEIANKKVLEDEGVYSDNINDRGGKTKYGITERIARKNGYKDEMKDLPLEIAIQIYKQEYWNPLHLDFVNNQTLAEILFQFGVNCGVKTACKSLQRALNILNRNSLNWLDIIVDGIMGIKTLRIVNNLNDNDLSYVCKITLGLQFEKYIAICERDSSQEVFIRGWINRIGRYMKGLFQ